jgi:lysozyme
VKTPAKAAGWALICVACVAPWEGLWTTAKPDRLAYNIPTVCYGETEGVKIGDHYTKEQCADMLAAKLPRYNAEISKCIHVPISDKTRAAFVSFAYNVGSGGFCRSSAARRLNAGDSRGACDALMVWNRAGGRVVKGLTNRRAAERKLCLEGIGEQPSVPRNKPWWRA